MAAPMGSFWTTNQKKQKTDNKVTKSFVEKRKFQQMFTRAATMFAVIADNEAALAVQLDT